MKVLVACEESQEVCKALLDIMTKLRFWNDDKQIYELHFGKYYSERPGIYIKIN